MKEKIYNSVVVRFIEHRAGVMNQAPTMGGTKNKNSGG